MKKTNGRTILVVLVLLMSMLASSCSNAAETNGSSETAAEISTAALTEAPTLKSQEVTQTMEETLTSTTKTEITARGFISSGVPCLGDRNTSYLISEATVHVVDDSALDGINPHKDGEQITLPIGTVVFFLDEIQLVPVIFMDYYVGKGEYDTVISDGFHGMYRLTNYLIEMGHREIGFFGTPLATSSITDRYLGYVKALMEAGIEPRKEWLIPDRELGTDAFVEVVLPERMPTAFACNCDVVAYRLIRKLKGQGLHVPEDVSVVGYDNYAYEDDSQDPVTTYDVGMRRMAETCVKTLVNKIHGDRYYKGVQIVTGHIVYKKSVRDINGRDEAHD